jgi:hypothetical protein
MDNGGATDVVVNGTRGGASEATVDGIPNMTTRDAVFSPPQDLVQEFKMHTATYDAAIGHAAGAVTNVSMKSGGNTPHGAVFLDRSTWRAVPGFQPLSLRPMNNLSAQDRERAVPEAASPRRRCDDRPVWIPKFYDGRNKTLDVRIEDLINHNLSFSHCPHGTAAPRRFSDLLKLGAAYQIYDPFTTVPAPNGRFSRSPLAGNIIRQPHQSGRVKLGGYYPLPNQPTSTWSSATIFSTQSINRENYIYTSRADHVFNMNRFFLRWNNQQHDNYADTLSTITNITLLDRTAWGVVVDDVHIQLDASKRHCALWSNINSRGSQGFDLTSLGLPSSLVAEINSKLGPNGIAFPETIIDGTTAATAQYTVLSANGGSTAATNYHTAQATVTRIAGSHSMRLGSEFRLMRDTGFNFGNVAPHSSSQHVRGPRCGAPIGRFASLSASPTGTISNNPKANERLRWHSSRTCALRAATRISACAGV